MSDNSRQHHFKKLKIRLLLTENGFELYRKPAASWLSLVLLFGAVPLLFTALVEEINTLIVISFGALVTFGLIETVRLAPIRFVEYDAAGRTMRIEDCQFVLDDESFFLLRKMEIGRVEFKLDANEQSVLLVQWDPNDLFYGVPWQEAQIFASRIGNLTDVEVRTEGFR